MSTGMIKIGVGVAMVLAIVSLTLMWVARNSNESEEHEKVVNKIVSDVNAANDSLRRAERFVKEIKQREEINHTYYDTQQFTLNIDTHLWVDGEHIFCCGSDGVKIVEAESVKMHHLEVANQAYGDWIEYIKRGEDKNGF